MFVCKKCRSERSISEMIGIVIGQISKDILIRHGVTRSSSVDVIKGILSGYKVECPKCNAHDWDYK